MTICKNVFLSTPPEIAQWTTSDAYNFKSIGPQRRWKPFTPLGIVFVGSSMSQSNEQMSGLLSNIAQNLCISVELALLFVWWWCLIITRPYWRNSPDLTLSIFQPLPFVVDMILAQTSLNYFIHIIVKLQSELVLGIRTACFLITFQFYLMNGSEVILIGINQAKQNAMHIFTDIYYFIVQNATQPKQEFVYRYTRRSIDVHLK